jgi:hypothetical protein
MSEISKELLEKLTNAKTREEAAALLKAEGIEDAPEEKIWEQVQQLRVSEAQELSLDELDDVAGGATERDWWTSGCAATVEPGSDCWGTDGGCEYCNIAYYNLPKYTCPRCNCFSAKKPYNAFGTWRIECKYCGDYETSIAELQASGLWSKF